MTQADRLSAAKPMMPTPQERSETLSDDPSERGQAMLALLVAGVLVTVLGVSMVSLMNADMTHASVQYAMSRSFYIAQAGLEEAKAHVFAAADPATATTPAGGVTVPYGGGQFTYWVDAGPAAGCEAGLKTLESLGQVVSLSRMIATRIRACAVPGMPFLAALFGVSPVQFQGTSHTYLAPYEVGTPGGGGNLGSFTEINFASNDVRLNALSEDATDMVKLRDAMVPDYMLFGFSTRPQYNPTPTAEPTPWVLGVFGDLIKAQPATGLIPNRCGTPHACLTVGNNITDVLGVSDLRAANYERHVYVRSIREEALPTPALDSETFKAQAANNIANANLNTSAGLHHKTDSVYTRMQFYQIMFYLETHPEQSLQGTVYIDGSFEFLGSARLGSVSGNVTLAVGGDLIVDKRVTVVNRHDLSTVAGRRTPGIVVLGSPEPTDSPTATCGGQQVSESGRLVMCEGSTLTVDGLVYTQDGMAVESGASVDQVGAMYHNNRGTTNPSFVTQDARVLLRFDPLALSVLRKGIAVLSWQQLP